MRIVKSLTRQPLDDAGNGAEGDVERREGEPSAVVNPLTRQAVDGAQSVTTAPVPASAAQGADAAAPSGAAGTKPTTDDPKVRVKPVHPAVAKAMKHAFSPPVLTTAAVAFLGVAVLAWITLGWAGVLAFVLAVVATLFGGALAWKRAGLRKAAPRKPNDRRGQPARGGSLAALLARRAARRGQRDTSGGQSGGGGEGGSSGSRGGLLGRLRRRFGKKPAPGGQAAHGSHSGGYDGGKPAGHKGAHRAKGGLRGVLARLGRKPTGGGGDKSSRPGRTDGGNHSGGGQRRGLRIPNLFRRKPGGGHGPGGGGSHDNAAGSGGHKPTRRGRRGGKNRNHGGVQPHGSDSSGKKRTPGLLRRFYRDYRAGVEQGKRNASHVGAPKQGPTRDGQHTGERRATQEQMRRPRTKPSSTFEGAVDLLDPGTCAKCGGPILVGEFAYPTRNGGLICPGCGLQPGFARPKAPLPKVEPNQTKNRDDMASATPTRGSHHEGNSTMSIRHNDDASLFAYLRNLTAISPVIGETATKVGAAQTQVAALAEGIKKMAVHGDSEQPASKKLVASVEALGQKIAGHAQEIEDIIAKIRQAEAEAEALKAEADREHEMDLARREGGRGGLQREMRADVSRGIQDT